MDVQKHMYSKPSEASVQSNVTLKEAKGWHLQPKDLLTLFFQRVQEPEPVELKLKLGGTTVLGELGAMLLSPRERRLKVLGFDLPQHHRENNASEDTHCPQRRRTMRAACQDNTCC